MSDSALILDYLQRYPGWQNAARMMKDMKPGCFGWAMRSRISDLNKKLPQEGLMIESRIGKDGMAEYKLVRIGSIPDSVISNQDSPGSREVHESIPQYPKGLETRPQSPLR